MKRLALTFLPLALTACATVPAASASPTAGIGEIASVGGLGIRPLALLEDSRCPASVQCVWAGQVRIRVIVDDAASRPYAGDLGNAAATAVAHELDLIMGTPVTLFGRTILLSRVTPPKIAPGSTEPGAYRFTFEISR